MSDACFVLILLTLRYIYLIADKYLIANKAISRNYFPKPRRGSLEILYFPIQDRHLIIISAKFIDPKGKLYHTGEIYINEQDFAVLKVDFSYVWMIRNLKPTKDFSLWIDNVKWQGRANYIKQDGKYQVSNLEYLHEKHAYTKDWRNRYKDLARYIIQSNFTNSCSKNTQ